MTRLYGLFLMLGTIALSACNTVEGAGRDMTAAGVAIQQEARSAR
ncbi:MAG: entericidin EcnAB [Rhodobacteraceae bacterium]|nr:entericidin EcnAB [Paracoccaceae bacterium]TVR50356.1 MAG: entericidin A/B family lipoprotein [Paracoccaceae bacterium]